MSKSIDNSQDVIDSRDIIERIAELTSELEDYYEQYKDAFTEDYEGYKSDFIEEHREDDEEPLEFEEWLDWSALEVLDFDSWKDMEGNEYRDEIEELEGLEDLAEQCDGYGDWKYGETLINSSYWVEYCEELVKDIGDLPRDISSYIEIDWSATAENLKVDYTEVNYNGNTYLIRSC